MTIKAIIFDLGGVILRTSDGAAREKLANELQITRKDLEFAVFSSPSSLAAEMGVITEEEHWRYILEQLGLPAHHHDHFREMFWAGDVMDDGLLEFIRQLKTKYRTGLLSNAWSGARTGVEQHYGKLDAFDVLVFSAEAGMRKPNPDIFTYILDKLGSAPQETVFVDDFIENIDAARAMGFHCVHFRNSEQAQQEVQDLLSDHNLDQI